MMDSGCIPNLSGLSLDHGAASIDGEKRFIWSVLPAFATVPKPVSASERDQVIARVDKFVRPSTLELTNLALQRAKEQQIALDLKLECLTALLLQPVAMQAPADTFPLTVEAFFDAYRSVVFYKHVEEAPTAPVTDMEKLKGIASKAAEGYFANIEDSQARVVSAKTMLTDALNSPAAADFLPQSVGAVYVSFYLCRNTEPLTTKPWGLFSPHAGAGHYVDERAQLVEGEDQVKTIEYDHASFLSNARGEVRDGNPVGDVTSTADYAHLSSESLEDLAEEANDVLPFCTFVEWKRALQQMYLQSQTTSGDLTKTILPTFKTKRITNKMMVQQSTQTTFEAPWCVRVTLAHTNPLSSGKRQKTAKKPVQVFVEEDLSCALKGKKWNDALYFYKSGSKTVGSRNGEPDYQQGAEVRSFSIEYFKTNAVSVQADAAFILNVSYGPVADAKPMQYITLNQGGGPDTICVSVAVRENQRSMYLNSLFYDLEVDERERCQIIVGDGSTKQGAGAVMLKALTSVCASLAFTSIVLADAARFVDTATMPYFGSVRITPYLRATRGYGYYEGMGFFKRIPSAGIDTIIDYQQRILNYHHELYTTKIGELRVSMQSEFPLHLFGSIIPVFFQSSYEMQDMEAIEGISAMLDDLDDMWDERSMRSILNEFNELVEPHRPSGNMEENTLVSKWADAVRDALNPYAYWMQAAYTLNLMDAANTIANFTNLTETVPLLCSEMKNIYWENDGTQVVAMHLQVEPSGDGGAPRVVRKAVDYNFQVR